MSLCALLALGCTRSQTIEGRVDVVFGHGCKGAGLTVSGTHGGHADWPLVQGAEVREDCTFSIKGIPVLPKKEGEYLHVELGPKLTGEATVPRVGGTQRATIKAAELPSVMAEMYIYDGDRYHLLQHVRIERSVPLCQHPIARVGSCSPGTFAKAHYPVIAVGDFSRLPIIPKTPGSKIVWFGDRQPEKLLVARLERQGPWVFSNQAFRCADGSGPMLQTAELPGGFYVGLGEIYGDASHGMSLQFADMQVRA